MNTNPLCEWPSCSCNTDEGEPCRFENPDFYIKRAAITASNKDKWQNIRTVPEGIEVIVRGGKSIFGSDKQGSSVAVIDDRSELFKSDGSLRGTSPTMWHPAPEPPEKEPT